MRRGARRGDGGRHAGRASRRRDARRRPAPRDSPRGGPDDRPRAPRHRPGAYAVVDCASTLPEDRGLVIADSALRLGADPDRIREIVSASAGRRGIVRARRVIALADGRSQSPGESLVRLHLHRLGLPAPDLQVHVGTRRGPFFLDLGWPARRVGLEFDGFVKYSGELGGTAPDTVFAEKRRQDAIEDEGWRVLRATWDDLATPGALATRLRPRPRGPTPLISHPHPHTPRAPRAREVEVLR